MDSEPVGKNRFSDPERIAFILQSAQIGSWDLDIEKQRVWWDDRCRELYGFPKEVEVPYDTVVEYIHPEDRSSVNEAVKWALNPTSLGTYEIEFRTIGAEDYKLRWVHCKGQAFFDEYGKPYRFTGIIQDITILMQTRLKLESSEQHWRSLVDHSPTGTAVYIGRNMTIQAVNKSMLRIWNKDTSIIGKDLMDAVPEFRNQPFLKLLQKVYDTGVSYHTPEGRADINVEGELKEFWFDYNYSPLFDEKGEVYGIINTATDITPLLKARKQSESLTRNFSILQDSQEWLSFIFEQAPVAIAVLTGNDYVIKFANESCYEIWQVPFRSVDGEPVFKAFPGMDGLGLQDILDQVRRSGVPHRGSEQKAELLRNGVNETVYINYVYAPIQTPENQVDVIFVGTEVTPQVIARQAIEESEKRYRQLASMLEQKTNQLLVSNQELFSSNQLLNERGEELAASNEEIRAGSEELGEINSQLTLSNERLQRFAYVASHDLQEPLRKIQTFGSLITQKYANELGEHGIAYLERMSKAGEQMSALIQDLLAYSKMNNQQVQLQVVSLRQVLEKVLNTLELRIEQTGAIIEIDTLPAILGDETQLGQLFQNLLSNSIKFSKPNQRPVIHITSRTIPREELPAEVIPMSQARRFRLINVSDNGVGFNEKFVDRIFEVFQRLHSKSDFKGTGIGLAICQRVVENHGGWISAHGEEGKGATFSIYLPA